MVGVLLELIEVACVLGLTFVLYPILKKRSEILAISYFGFRVFEAMMLVVSLLSALSMITLSSQYISGGYTDVVLFETIGIGLQDLRHKWSLHVLALFHPLAAMPLYYFLYKTKLIPKFLSAWGFLSALWLVVDEVILESFGLGFLRITGMPIGGISMGANEVVLGVWLLWKGFNDNSNLDYSEE